MRRFSLMFAAAAVLLGSGAAAQSRSSDLPVASGQAAYLSLGGAVRDVVVADPSIADVSVVSDRVLVVMGKRAGFTSLLAFGPGGRPLADRQVVVSDGGAGAVTVYRGAAASTYACASQCTRLPAPAPTTAP